VVYFITVRHLSFLTVSVVALLSVPLFVASATPILGAIRCDDIEGRLSTPLDPHTEARYRKYLSRSSHPKTFATQQDAERWCFLVEEREASESENRSSREDFRRRTLIERFDNINLDTSEEMRIVPEAPLTDTELTDLPPSRQARILRKIRLRNCSVGGGTETETEEYAICIKELKKSIQLSDDAVVHRRVSRLAKRISKTTTINDALQKQRTGDYTRGTAAQDMQSIRQAVTIEKEFDLKGPGSQPLSTVDEAKIKLYVARGDCSRMSLAKSKVRCEWLMQYGYSMGLQRSNRLESRLRAFGLLNGTVLRRGISQTYRSAIGSTQGILNTRRLQGFRPSPRTIQEAKENFQSPVVIPGD